MGSVEAVAEELDDGTTRVVALKRILRTAGTDASRLEMFLREARLTTLLSHPNVIRSLAFGEALGEVYLAMEYVAGEPLSRVIVAARERGEKLPLPLIAFILAEACEGLHAAHELTGDDGAPLGVVHRDVSPHNLMVGFDGGVKLLDFGVAKIDMVESTARTKTGEVKGKTAYMSPEQAMGETVDRRSDLYSVGAVLFECLKGERMWGAGTDFDVLRRLALEEPPSLTTAGDDIPDGLVTLFSSLIERDRDKRPATAGEVAKTLRTYAGATGASDVRAVMSRLFPGEHEKREAALEAALRDEGTRASTETTPVFVTHHGEPEAASRRRAWIYGAVAVVVGTAATLAFRAPARTADQGTATEAPKADETPKAPPAPSAIAATPPSPPLATPRELASSVSPSRPPRVSPRRVASPRLSTEPSPPASAAPVSSAPAPKKPEPPDLDPTPF
jgi:serine/threonine-protein kinase